MVLLLLIGIGISFIGAMFLGIITIIKKNIDGVHERCTNITEGKIDEIWEQYSGFAENNKKSYYPIYKYIVDGKEYKSRSSFGLSSPKNINKESRIIHYNPNNPSEFYCDEENNDGIINLFKILGGVLLSIGLLLLILYFIM